MSVNFAYIKFCSFKFFGSGLFLPREFSDSDIIPGIQQVLHATSEHGSRSGSIGACSHTEHFRPLDVLKEENKKNIKQRLVSIVKNSPL